MKLEKDIKFLEEEKVIKIIFLFKSFYIILFFLYYFIFFINFLFFLGQDVVRRRTGIFFNSITE
jgi:hypothetical protein